MSTLNSWNDNNNNPLYKLRVSKTTTDKKLKKENFSTKFTINSWLFIVQLSAKDQRDPMQFYDPYVNDA